MTSVYIHETAVVEPGAVIGKGSKIWHFVHIRDQAHLGKNVIVGKSSYIDTNVIIGDNCKIQNLVSIFNGVTIGNDVFVGPHVTFTNDLYPRSRGVWEVVPTKIEDGVSLGANSTILCGINIGKHALVAAGAVVISNVPDRGIVAGNPAKLKGYACVCSRKILDKDTAPGNYSILCENCKKENNVRIV